MALTPGAVAGLLQASLAGAGVLGTAAPQVAAAVASGFVSYVTSSPTVQTADVGTLGAGVGNGVGLIVTPGAISGPLSGFLAGAGILGVVKDAVAAAIGSALSSALSTAQILTTHPGTGVGTGTVVTVIPVPSASVPLMVAAFSGLTGVYSAPFAAAVAQAVDAALPTAKGLVAITGPSSPYPGGGTGVGKIL